MVCKSIAVRVNRLSRSVPVLVLVSHVYSLLDLLPQEIVSDLLILVELPAQNGVDSLL